MRPQCRAHPGVRFTEEVSGRGPESLRGETGGGGRDKPMETGGNRGDDTGSGALMPGHRGRTKVGGAQHNPGWVICQPQVVTIGVGE